MRFQSGEGPSRCLLHDCKTSHNLRQPSFQALLSLLLTPPVCRSCYSLLSQGPCGEAEWLVLEAGHSVLCRPRLCPCDPRSDSNASRVSTIRTFGECFYPKKKYSNTIKCAASKKITLPDPEILAECRTQNQICPGHSGTGSARTSEHWISIIETSSSSFRRK